jgi:predicted DsbA family dithiol-disulfide isomerase
MKALSLIFGSAQRSRIWWYADAVRADQALARELGIDAVPCFVIERQDGLRGAQHPEQLLELLELNWRAGHG